MPREQLRYTVAGRGNVHQKVTDRQSVVSEVLASVRRPKGSEYQSHRSSSCSFGEKRCGTSDVVREERGHEKVLLGPGYFAPEKSVPENGTAHGQPHRSQNQKSSSEAQGTII